MTNERHPRERPMPRTLDDLPRPHRARYEFASRRLPKRATVLDAACGVGYGGPILGPNAHSVTGVDIAPSALEHAAAHFPAPNVSHFAADLTRTEQWTGTKYDAIVAFGILERVEDPAALMRGFHLAMKNGGLLIGSAANELAVGFQPGLHPYHRQHFMASQIAELLRRAQFIVLNVFDQRADGTIAASHVAAADVAGHCTGESIVFLGCAM